LIDFMAEDGVVGPYNGSQAREVVITLQQWEEMSGQASSGSPVATPKPRPSNKILLESPGPNARATAGDSPSFPARSADKFDDDEDFEEEDSEEEDFDEEDVEEECDEEAPDDEAEQDEEYDELDAPDDEDGEIDDSEDGEEGRVDSDGVDGADEEVEEEEQACEELGPEDYFDEDEGTYRDDNSGNKRGGNESKRRIANKGRTGRLGGSGKQDGQPKVSPPNRRWKAESA
jgi:hypothetical protein